jgi:hypothetical protein
MTASRISALLTSASGCAATRCSAVVTASSGASVPPAFVTISAISRASGSNGMFASCKICKSAGKRAQSSDGSSYKGGRAESRALVGKVWTADVLHRPILAKHHDAATHAARIFRIDSRSSAPAPTRVTAYPRRSPSWPWPPTLPAHPRRRLRRPAWQRAVPSRRATSATEVPGTRLSAAIRARSAFLRRRRPFGPSITSSSAAPRPSSLSNGRPLCRLFSKPTPPSSAVQLC